MVFIRLFVIINFRNMHLLINLATSRISIFIYIYIYIYIFVALVDDKEFVCINCIKHY